MTTSTASTNHNEHAPAELSVDLTRNQTRENNLPEWPLGDLPGPQAGRRRRFTSEEKRQFIKQAMAPGESMSSVGRRHGLSVSLLFRWRRQLDNGSRTAASDGAPKNETRELRDRVRELERLLGRKTLEAELLQQELMRLGHNPGAALLALDAEPSTETRR